MTFLLFAPAVFVIAGSVAESHLSPSEQAFLRDHSEIVFVSQTDYPPFEFVDDRDERRGMCIELVQWIASEFDFRARFIDMPFADAQEAVLSGEADVLTSLFYSELRDERFDFTFDLFEVPASIFVRLDRSDITDIEDLQGRRIAMQRGDYANEFLHEAGIDFTVVPTEDFFAATDLVISGDADALVGDEQIVLYYIQESGLLDQVKIVGTPLYVGLNCMAVRDGQRELLNILNRGIAHARARGVFQSLTNKWVGVPSLPNPNWLQRHAWHILIILGSIVALAIFAAAWNVELRRRVHQRTQDLAESEGRLRTLINSMPDIVCFKDGVGRWLEANEYDLRLFQLEGVDYRGKKDSEMAEFSPFYREAFLTCEKSDEEAWRAGTLTRAEETIPQQEGPPKVYDVIKVPTFHEDGRRKGLLVVGRDITERKQAERDKAALHRLAQRLTEARTLSEVGQIAAEESRRIFEHDAFIFNHIDDARHMLVSDYAEDTPVGESTPVRFDPGEIPLTSVQGRDWEFGNPQLINRSKANRAQGYVSFGEKSRFSMSLMYVPIVWTEKIIGWLSTQSYTFNKYSKTDVGRLEELASQCAGALLRVCAEEERRASEERRLAMAAALPDLLFRYSRNGTFLDCQFESEDDLMAPANSIIGANIRDLGLPQSFVEQTLEVIERTFATGELQVMEYRLAVRRGLRDFEARFVPCGSDEVLCIIRDITGRRRAEEALRESEERFRVLVENAPEAIVVLDVRANRFIDVNDNAVALFGLPRETLLEKSPGELSPPTQPGGRSSEVEVRNIVQRAVEGESPVFEWTHCSPERPEIPCEVRLVRLPSADRLLIRGSITDITMRKQMEEEHWELEAQIQHAQKLESLGVLAGGIAHDFNNLLVAIMGNAGLALMDLPPDAPGREIIEQIEFAAQRAADLTRQLLAYSGKGKFIVEPIHLSKVLDEMSHLLETSISKKITFQKSLDPDIPLINADVTQIRQIILNLLTNASEAIGDRAGTITLSTGVADAATEPISETYQISNLSEGRCIFIEVTDDGCGMDEDTRLRIFDPFFTTKFTGRGLGMAAVLGIIRGHSGAIRVQSEPNKGTSIRVLLPLADDLLNLTEEIMTGENSPTNSQSEANGTILIADDEATVRDLTERVIKRAGFDVLIATDGIECVDVFREHANEIVLVLLDMTMPRMDGVEAFNEMRAIRPDVRVLLSSGFNEQETTSHFSDHGLAGFIQKPYSPRALIDKIQEILLGIS